MHRFQNLGHSEGDKGKEPAAAMTGHIGVVGVGLAPSVEETPVVVDGQIVGDTLAVGVPAEPSVDCLHGVHEVDAEAGAKLVMTAGVTVRVCKACKCLWVDA